MTIKVHNLDAGSCVPLVGAYVDIWHCDAKGIYSDESTYNPGGGTGSVNTSGQKFLRGYQITDENGQVKASQERMLATTTGGISSGYQSEITVGVSLQAPAVHCPP